MKGLKWKKTALHVHTPASEDYEGDKSITPKQFLHKISKQKVDVLGITDHNSVEWISKIRKAKEELELDIAIFPGIEISTKDPIHILVLFDPEKPINEMINFLGEIAINQDKYGTDEKCKYGLTTNYELEPIVKDHNGFIIFPHIKSSKGIFKRFEGGGIKDDIIAKGNYIYECQESLIDSLKATYKNIPFIKKTDFHNIDDFEKPGNYTWLKLAEKPDIFSLKQILFEPDMRISLEKPKVNTDFYLKHLKITSEYFGQKVIEFNSELNIIIGGRGTGKSLIVEILAFLTNKYPNSTKPLFINYLEKMNALFKEGDNFELLFFSKGSDYKLKRTFSDFEIKESPFREIKHDIERYNEENSYQLFKKISDEWTNAKEEDLDKLLPVRIFTQNGISDIVHNRKNLNKIIDEHGILSSNYPLFVENQKKLEEKKEKLSSLEKKLLSNYSDLKNPAEISKEIENKRKEISKLEKEISNQELKKKSLLESQKNLTYELIDYLQKYETTSFNALQELKKADELEDTEITDNKFIERTQKKVMKLQKYNLNLIEKLNEIKNNYSNFKEMLEETRKKIYDEWNDFYSNEINNLSLDTDRNEQDINNLLNKKRKALQDLTKQQHNNQEIIRKIKSLEQKREKIITEIRALEEEIFNFRKNICNKLDGRMEAKNVRIQIEKRYDKSQSRIFLVEDVYHQYPNKNQKIKRIIKTLKYKELCDFIKSPNNQAIIEKLELTENEQKRFKEIEFKNFDPSISGISNQKLLKIDSAPMKTKVILQMKKNEKWRDLDSLSPGERCSLLLMLLLAKNNNILVIDQPEDELDYESRSNIVDLIKKRKNNRQMIFVTHFQNIPVLADAENIIHMEEIEGHGKIKGQGSFEEMISSIIEMEGGENAIRLRNLKYDEFINR
ncbi:MAG: AAA family ATPase [Candidatus Lokiarchaeota archaeon]|nr:AAA family ATPase [Candidatus Lokiarchaeota archaeon]